MTASIKEALEQIAARSIAQNDDDEKELRRQLYHIDSLAKSALSSLSSGEARERIARCIVGPHKPVPFGSKFTLEELREVRWNNSDGLERALAISAADAILATGCVPGEASIRADQKERDARIAEQFGEPYALNTNTGAMMFRAVTDKIAAAIRAGRG